VLSSKWAEWAELLTRTDDLYFLAKDQTIFGPSTNPWGKHQMRSIRVELLTIAISLSPFAFHGTVIAQDDAAPAEVQEAAPAPEATAVETGESAEGTAEAAPSESRFRWGISGAGGPLMGGYSGGAGGIDARFGMQLDSLLGIYAQPMLLLGAGVTADAEGASASGVALYGVGVLADVTLADLFYAGLGPELLLGAIAEAEANSTTSSASGATGPFFSLALRTGFAFGSVRPTRRHAFTVGLDMHMVFANELAVMPLVALGYEAF
jgi:hypothetical protein